MKRMVLALGFLAGCSTHLDSTVTVFHELNGGQISYCLDRLHEQENSLEHASYESLVRQELAKRNFHETSCDTADLVAMFAYSIDGGRPVISSYPIFGQTGVSSSTTYGTVNSFADTATYSGTTTYHPTFGVVGTGTRTDVMFTRTLVLALFDRKLPVAQGAPKKVYEATLTSTGSTGQLPVVMPTMLRELFEDFPGKSGSTRHVSQRLRP